MPFAKEYETFEARALLRQAEGRASPVTGAAGHSQGLHAMSHGGLDRAAQVARLAPLPGETNRQHRNRVPAATGAFMNMVQQAAAACDGLNSPQGQAALAVLDDPAHSATNIRITLTVAGVKEAGFLPASLAPHSTNVTRGATNATTGATAGVKMIIDRAGGGTVMQIQTCYPLSGPTVSAWSATNNATRAVLANG